MILLAISLLSVLAGTLLLAKFKKDMPGKIFVLISWFFIVVGFILFIGFIIGGIYKVTNCGFPGHHGCQHEMMMKNCNHGMHGKCCNMMGMEKGMQGKCCCMEGMDKGMCCKMMEGMSHDSMMKMCPKHMQGDSTKMLMQKK